MGSIKDAKKAPVENIAKAIEILATLMEAKNVIQCSAIIIPPRENLIKVFGETDKFIPFIFIKTNIKTPAITIRYQTSGMASSAINSPKIAVNPARNTKKCRWI